MATIRTKAAGKDKVVKDKKDETTEGQTPDTPDTTTTNGGGTWGNG